MKALTRDQFFTLTGLSLGTWNSSIGRKESAPNAGDAQSRYRVYDREGKPCRRCRTPIRRIVQGQRSTFFCPRCQT